MDMANKLGQMEPSIPVSGEKTGLTAKESSSTLTEMCTMASGRMIKQMVLEFTDM